MRSRRKSLVPARYRRSRPYIYTELEIEQIVREAARLPSVNGIRALTFATLFGLIAVTGLRVGEAIALDNCDADLENGVLSVRRGKTGMRGSFRYHRASRTNSPPMPRSAIGFWAARRHRYSSLTRAIVLTIAALDTTSQPFASGSG